MNAVKNVFLAAVWLGLASCSPQLSPFTERLYEEQRWTDDELRRIQFYLSDDIVLRRQFSGADAKIEGGTIKIVGGKQVEEVLIRRGTPGVFLFSPKRNRFAVSFEAGSDTRFLMFGPNPKANGRFALLAADWEREQGTVTYDNRKYQVDAASAWATLLVDLKRMSITSVNSRTAQGRKVN